jgi:dihydrofolate synthase/folylpolyglutamate synthase
VPTPADARRAALEQVEWPARLEWREWRGHHILIDGAHNPAGARALAAYLREATAAKVPLVIGMMADKDLDGILAALLPLASHVVCTAADTLRAATPESIAARARIIAPDVPVLIETRAAGALDRALPLGSPVVVAGSLFLAGEMRSLLS